MRVFDICHAPHADILMRKLGGREEEGKAAQADEEAPNLIRQRSNTGIVPLIQTKRLKSASLHIVPSGGQSSGKDG
jgi:hypothetical protein